MLVKLDYSQRKLVDLSLTKSTKLPCTSVEAFISVRIGVTLEQLALAVAQAFVEGDPVVADGREDHGLVRAQVVVHADAEQGLEQDCLMIKIVI